MFSFFLSTLKAFPVVFATLSAQSDVNLCTAKSLSELVASSDTAKFTLCANVDCLVRNGKDSHFFSVSDKTGFAAFYYSSKSASPLPRPGDLIRVSGCLKRVSRSDSTLAVANTLEIISPSEARAPKPVPLRDICCGNHPWEFVSVKGLIRDAFQSETTCNWAILTLCDDGSVLRIHIPIFAEKFEDFTRLIGSVVSVKGFANPHNGSHRKFAGSDFQCPGMSDIKIISPLPDDPFTAPNASALLGLSPERIATTGRVKAKGWVLCTWDKNTALVQTESAGCILAYTETPTLPAKETYIEMTGFPQSDLFHLTLTRVRWRASKATNKRRKPEIRMTSAKDVILGIDGITLAKPHLHGQPIKLTGRVRNISESPAHTLTIQIEDGEFIVPILISESINSPRDIPTGAIVSVQGICCITAEYWRPGIIIPQVKNFSIIVNDDSGITILSMPPWWSPQKLVIVIASLLAMLGGILGWNLTLRKAAERKGRELMREQLGHIKAELKTEERTRLSVELHDTLAQNLTGVSLEIDTATKIADIDPTGMKTHLGIAARSLKSCRDELRNCLWDLRNRALETRTMDEAIRQTLAPHVAGVEVAIRFAVPRERISDNSAHAILRIIRELTLNGIRHGGANKIWIAGSIDGERMLFSVRDNGCGFDPDTAPGFSEGHYGLLGIQERVDEFEGEFTLTSTSGKGTRATVSLNVPQEA